MVETLVVRVIKPSMFKEKEFQRAARALEDFAKKVKADYQKTTRTWSHKVVFHRYSRYGLRELAAGVDTEDEIYGYVERGTKPHVIMAGIYTGKSNKKALAFPSVFRPKTKPRVIGSAAGYKGGATIVRPFVQHPGTEAREFSKTIKKEREPWFRKRVDKAMSQARKASGHAI